MRLKNRVAIVTGAAGGIGRAISLALAGKGADLTVNDVAREPLDKVVAEIKALGRKALPVVADVTKSRNVRQMVRTTLDELGSIDILVNVAGGSGSLRRPRLFHQIPDKYWNAVIDLNLKGTMICSHEVIKSMIQRGRGKIINIGSVAGMIGSSIGMADYSAAKAGVIGFTKALAKELAAYGINVNCVSPGPIQTALYDTLDHETQKKLQNGTYLKRLGKPEEVANLIVFLASEDASFITGQNYAVCGGRSLGW